MLLRDNELLHYGQNHKDKLSYLNRTFARQNWTLAAQFPRCACALLSGCLGCEHGGLAVLLFQTALLSQQLLVVETRSENRQVFARLTVGTVITSVRRSDRRTCWRAGVEFAGRGGRAVLSKQSLRCAALSARIVAGGGSCFSTLAGGAVQSIWGAGAAVVG